MRVAQLEHELVVDRGYVCNGETGFLNCGQRMNIEVQRVLRTWGEEENVNPGMEGAMTWYACCLGLTGLVSLSKCSTCEEQLSLGQSVRDDRHIPP